MRHNGVEIKVAVSLLNREGSNLFTGKVTIGETVFECEVEPTYPFDDHNEVMTGKTLREFQELFPIRIKKGGVGIDLGVHEYEIFYYILVGQVANLHNARVFAKRKGLQTGDGAYSEGGGSIAFKSEACRILMSPKFGCIILDSDVPTDAKPN